MLSQPHLHQILSWLRLELVLGLVLALDLGLKKESTSPRSFGSL